MSNYNPNIHHRRSIRLKGYDYSKEGLYFITICCKDRIRHFRKIENGEMVLNEFNMGESHSPILNSSQNIPDYSFDVGAIVRGFKSSVTKQLNLSNIGFPVWQRNYHEHIIRDDKSYKTIADYIINNPAKWNDDKFYTK